MRLVLFCVTIVGVFCGAVFGLGGAGAIADYLYGAGALSLPLSHVSWGTTFVLAVLVLGGMIVGAVGVLVTLVLPLHFAFPGPSRRFWRGVISDRGLSRWYFHGLEQLLRIDGQPQA